MVILATAYSLSSLVCLTAAMAVKVIFNSGHKIEIPVAVYIAAQAMFLLVYLPTNLGKINNFGLVRNDYHRISASNQRYSHKLFHDNAY